MSGNFDGGAPPDKTKHYDKAQEERELAKRQEERELAKRQGYQRDKMSHDKEKQSSSDVYDYNSPQKSNLPGKTDNRKMQPVSDSYDYRSHHKEDLYRWDEHQDKQPQNTFDKQDHLKTQIDKAKDLVSSQGFDIIADGLGFEGAGLLKVPIDQLFKLIEAINETKSAQVKDSILSGMKYGLLLIRSDHSNPNNQHILEGKEYTKSGLSQRIENSSLSHDKNDEMPLLSVLNSDAPKQFEDGLASVADAANSILKEFKNSSPHDRQIAMKVFTDYFDSILIQQKKNLRKSSR